jgi:hypothetical protein
MTRSLLCLAVFVSASAAHAEPFSLDITQVFTPPATAASVFNLHFVRYDYATATRSLATALSIPVAPAETATAWTIDATNASQFGLDWAEAATWSYELKNESPNHWPNKFTWSYGTPPPLKQAGIYPLWSLGMTRDQRLIDFELHAIEVTQLYWVNFPWLQQASISWRLIGDGRIIPEPSTLALVIPSLLLFSNARGNRPPTRRLGKTSARSRFPWPRQLPYSL